MIKTRIRDERPLFVFEMANNHMGDVQHGLRIIREMAEAVGGFSSAFQLGFKLQYRNLDTFIHPDYQNRTDLKYVKRFNETRLTADEFLMLKEEMKRVGFVTICTPFDEASVGLIEKQGFDIIKIASCSFTDWPLLERIATSDKPVIASAAGIDLQDIDNVVSFFEHRNKCFTLMHCVAEYPTANINLQLNQLDLFRQRYPQIRIGFSTHENPVVVDSVKMAIAKGATVFEKHVGIPTAAYALNEYSATPEQIRRWLHSAQEALEMCGVSGERAPFSAKEKKDLRSLRRGVFAKRDLETGEQLDLNKVFLAIPVAGDDQLTANDLSKYSEFCLEQPIAAGKPVTFTATRFISQRARIEAILKKVTVVLERSHVPVPRKLDFEISHHYGLDRFDEFGLTIINIVNREYCKKLLVLLPDQTHPEQYHQVKEETFHVLYGSVSVVLDGVSHEYSSGEVLTIERGVRHAFSTTTGAVVEEISSTHYVSDSFYTDPAINENKKRKTLITHWVR